MTKEHQLALMKFLKNIKKVDICISTMNVEYVDIGKTQGIPIVNWSITHEAKPSKLENKLD